ncbi:MAG: hypothetical protein ACR2QE_13385, partial [Acidimicrobiales bacterium]
MSDSSQGPGWWQASDGKWYPPEQQPATPPSATPPPGAPGPAPAGQGASIDIGKALSYGWNGFVQNIGTIIVLFLVIVGVQVVFNIIGQSLSSDNVILGLIVYAIGWIVSLMISVGLIRAGLAIVAGQKPEVGMLFQGDHIGAYFLASLLVGLMTMVGLLLCVIPGLLVLFFTFFYGFFIVDKNMGPTDGISASYNLVKGNAGNLLGFMLVAIILLLVTCGLASPIVWIAGTYVYKTLLGEP